VQFPVFPTKVDNQPVRGRLILAELDQGYRVQFAEVPPLSWAPLIDSIPNVMEKRVTMAEMLGKFVEKDIVEVVHKVHSFP
jgi:hypothetical protein